MINFLLLFKNVTIAAGYDVIAFVLIFSVMRNHLLKQRNNVVKVTFAILLWFCITIFFSGLSSILSTSQSFQDYDYFLSFKLEFPASLICCILALFGVELSFKYKPQNRNILLIILLCFILLIRFSWALINFFQYCNLRVCHFTNPL
jgi:hypothetical protein